MKRYDSLEENVGFQRNMIFSKHCISSKLWHLLDHLDTTILEKKLKICYVTISDFISKGNPKNINF